MKTIFTLFASTLLTVSVFAADVKPTSSIIIKTTGESDIQVVLDGKRFQPSDNAIVISGLREGTHSVKVLKERRGRGFNFQNRFDVVYNGAVQIRRWMDLSMTIERNGQARFAEARIVDQSRGGNNHYDYDNDYDRNDGRNNDGDYGRNDGNNGQWGGYDQHEAYTGAMNSREFDQVLQSINKEWLEGNKLKSATQIVHANAVTAAQVTQLMQLFAFENNKLELAKAAFRSTVDKSNYYQVVNALTFTENRNELERFMRTSR